MKEIRIGNHSIGNNHPPFIIAELSGNHNGSLERALEMVEMVARAGAQAVKLQTYTADTMTLDLAEGEFLIDEPNNPWRGQTAYQLYEKAHTPWEWHAPIFKRARELGLEAFSSPFDETAVDFLMELEVPAFKLASFEHTHIPLVKKLARTGKPLIFSCGMATIEETEETLAAARAEGAEKIILLKCTSSYPASPEDSHLRTIPDMAARFNCQIGLSDHTLGIGAAVASVALGATVIEKHVTLSRDDGGVDAAFSLEPDELTALVEETHRAWQAMGEARYGTSDTQFTKHCRSVYVCEDMAAGEAFNQQNIRVIRPGLGLEPKYYEAIVGRKAACDLKRGTALGWEHIEGGEDDS